jgi:hypothetical protein
MQYPRSSLLPAAQESVGFPRGRFPLGLKYLSNEKRPHKEAVFFEFICTQIMPQF